MCYVGIKNQKNSSVYVNSHAIEKKLTNYQDDNTELFYPLPGTLDMLMRLIFPTTGEGGNSLPPCR